MKHDKKGFPALTIREAFKNYRVSKKKAPIKVSAGYFRNFPSDVNLNTLDLFFLYTFIFISFKLTYVECFKSFGQIKKITSFEVCMTFVSEKENNSMMQLMWW